MTGEKEGKRFLRVRDIMVPLDEYATIDMNASLFEAIMALEKASELFDRKREKHRAVLVLDQGGNVVGKLSQFDIIRALEPRYDRVAQFDRLSHFGLNAQFIRDMVKNSGLWKDTLENLCHAAASVKVNKIMYTPKDDEYVTEGARLAEAMHQLMMGRHLSLLVTKGERITGILRLSDVFNKVCDLVKECGF